MNLRLSVVVPTYGRSDSLARLLDCLHAQTLLSMEILVIDQNDTGFLSDRLSAGRKKGVGFIPLDKPNASSARNLGWSQSKGNFVLFIDDDLEPEPDFCQRALDVLEAHPEVRCLCPVPHTGDRQQALSSLRRSCMGPTIPHASLIQIRQTISAAVFFERKYFLFSGGFDELVFDYARTAEDQELFLRMGRRGLKIWLNSELFVFHNEKVSGGCELRTSSQSESRMRCIKSWALRHRIHRGAAGRLTFSDVFSLARSSFLNTSILRRDARSTWNEIVMLRHAIIDSKSYLQPRLHHYKRFSQINHLKAYFD